MRGTLWLSSAFVGSILLSSASLAQNLAPNSELDVDDDGWFEDSGTASWIAQDADDCQLTAGSGGLELISSSESLPRAQINGGCFAVVPAQYLCFAMDYIHGADLAMIGVTFFPDAACELEDGGAALIGGPGAVAEFVTIHTCTTVPPGMIGARMRIDTLDFDGVPYDMVADRFYAGPLDRVYSDDFEAGSPCRWTNTAP